MLIIIDTWVTTARTIAHLEDGVRVVILVSLERAATTFTSMAWEGRARSLGATRTLFINLIGVMVVTPTTFLKTNTITWGDFSAIVW